MRRWVLWWHAEGTHVRHPCLRSSKPLTVPSVMQEVQGDLARYQANSIELQQQIEDRDAALAEARAQAATLHSRLQGDLQQVQKPCHMRFGLSFVHRGRFRMSVRPITYGSERILCQKPHWMLSEGTPAYGGKKS